MKTLAIELTNRCNAKCEFCINKRFKCFGDMSDEVFNKVLKDAQEFDLEVIVLNNIGEPFLRKDLFDKIRQIRKVFPKTKIVMFTNGSFLSEKYLKEIKKLNVSLSVSLNAATPNGRERMGLDNFDKVKKMIDLGIKMGAINKVTFVDISPLISHPSLCKKEENITKEIQEFWKMYPKNGQVIPYANYAGSMFDTFSPKHFCNRARREMAVLFDGTVTLCCMTSLNVNFGNIKDRTLKEIWNSKERQDYKTAAEKGELFGVCSNCTGA